MKVFYFIELLLFKFQLNLLTSPQHQDKRGFNNFPSDTKNSKNR